LQESARQNEYANRWLSTDASARDKIKRESLTTLGSSSHKAGGVAAQVVAAIAAVELPHDQWPDLIGSLLGFVNNPQAPSNLKIATLQAIGFICESIVCFFVCFGLASPGSI
jgi:importin subunit beta-1